MQRQLRIKTMIRHIGMVGLLLVGMPLAVFAQTAPVTVVVEFPGGETASPLTSNTPLASSESTDFKVFKDLVLPTVETQSSKEQREAAAAQGLPTRFRVFGGTVRYERVDVDNSGGLDLDGNVYSTTVRLSWEVDDFTYGFLVPFDFLDLNDVNAYRAGILPYGQYSYLMSDLVTLDIIINGLYTYTGFDDNDFDNVNTLGGGAGLSLTLDTDLLVVSGAVSYQFTADDSDRADDHQHLLRVGANMGLRLGQSAAVTVYGIWNRDATNHDDTVRDLDDDYFDLGLEVAWDLSPNWSFTGGYKRVLDLDDFESNMVYLGTLLRF